MFLLLALYFVAGTTLAGSFMVAALVMGYTTAMPIIYACATGFILGLPVTWFVAKKLRE
ncbi:MAG: CTP synthetase [Rhodobacterales bacterium]|nr:MAG: CTP synthetase [Rhodobacterales bacterium]